MVDLAFDEIVLRALLNALQRDVFGVVASQNNDRDSQRVLLQCAEGVAAETVRQGKIGYDEVDTVPFFYCVDGRLQTINGHELKSDGSLSEHTLE